MTHANEPVLKTPLRVQESNGCDIRDAHGELIACAVGPNRKPIAAAIVSACNFDLDAFAKAAQRLLDAAPSHDDWCERVSTAVFDGDKRDLVCDCELGKARESLAKMVSEMQEVQGG